MSRFPIDQVPYRMGFLLIDNFTLISLASAIEPLRMANQLTGYELYQWSTFSLDGKQVCASDGLKVAVDKSIDDAATLDTLIVVGGVDITNSFCQKQLQWLQKLDKKGIRLGGVCTGAYVLAAAGLMNHVECSVHWECFASISETFPKVLASNRLYTISKERVSSSGGVVPMDMMLGLIRQQHGNELMSAISDMFICDRVRTDSEQQRVPLRHIFGTSQPKLLELVALMESNSEEPIHLDELARYVNISRRQLERLFQKHLNCTPSRYYLKLRLARARQLLKHTSMSIIDIATACGFVSTPHFSKCYRDYTGISPREERKNLRQFPRESFTNGNISTVRDSPIDLTPTDISREHSSMSSLQKAQNEPSYGSVAVSNRDKVYIHNI